MNEYSVKFQTSIQTHKNQKEKNQQKFMNKFSRLEMEFKMNRIKYTVFELKKLKITTKRKKKNAALNNNKVL